MQTTKDDIKVALLICNGDYQQDETTEQCPDCKNHLSLSDLNAKETGQRLRQQLEKLGYLVIAFLDLTAECYLRVIKFFRWMCSKAKKASLLFYVSGHGFYMNNQDLLIPSDALVIFVYSENKNIYMKEIFLLSCCANRVYCTPTVTGVRSCKSTGASRHSPTCWRISFRAKQRTLQNSM